MAISRIGAVPRPTRFSPARRPTLLRLLLRTVLLWRGDIKTARARAGFVALPDHTLRDIGVTRHSILEAESHDRTARRARS